MLMRLIMATGVFAVGYYLGREVGRQEPVLRELDAARSSGDLSEVGASEAAGDTVAAPPDGESDE